MDCHKETTKKGEGVVIDLGSIDTQKLLMQGGNNSGNNKNPPNYANKLSSMEMDSLKSLSDTLLPAIEPPTPTVDESVARYYRTSASMAGTPEYLGGLISERLGHHVRLMRILFLLLSTRIGTLIMGGTMCISPCFPFIQKFSQLPLHKRQQIVLSWSTSCFFLYRMAFVGVKVLIMLAFFTQVDEKEENVSWKAIGYDGPDPQFKTQKKPKTNTPCSNPQLSNNQPAKSSQSPNEENKQQAQPNIDEELYGPLHKGIINLKHPRPILIESLRFFGFHVSVDNKNKQHNYKSPSMTIKCDAVVVGSGSGGGVVAGILASKGYKVLVLEKGEYCARTNLTLLEGESLDRMYEGSGMVSTRDLGAVILAGSTVGGGSNVNWSASIRTPRHVAREWAQEHELEFFESELYREALDVVCSKMGVQSKIDDEGLCNDVLRKGCLELGYSVESIPRNSPEDHYCGWCGFGCKDGKKKGTCETWLKDVVDSNNGAILVGCEVMEVLHKRKKGRAKRKAYGVGFMVNGEFCVVEAKATIVACGALNTPPLLKRSGIKNSNIGKNLHIHPVVMAWGHFPDTKSAGSEEGKIQKRSYEGGIMTAMSTIIAEFDKSGYGVVIQTPSMHPGLFAVMQPWLSGFDFKHQMTKFSKTVHFIAIARDTGSGTIHSSPLDISYNLSPLDETNLKRGVDKMLRILAAAGAEEIGTTHLSGESINVKKSSYHEFEKFVKRESSRSIKSHVIPIGSAHQMGSCRMGVDPKKSVVNQWGESWEIEGLYLADSSVFPTALGVNPMVTVQAIAYCTAQSVVELLRRKRK